MVEKALSLDSDFGLLKEEEIRLLNAYEATGRQSQELAFHKAEKQYYLDSSKCSDSIGASVLLKRGLEAITQSVDTQSLGKPVISIVTPYDQNKLYIKPKYIDGILDSSGDLKSIYKGSRHRICRLKFKQYDFHLKQNPSHPLMDYAVHQLISRISDRKLSPNTMLLRFDVSSQGKTKSYPVLMSETILGENPKDSSHRDIDPSSLTWTTLTSMLTRPGDGGFAKYLIDDQKNLLCINHTASFVEPLTKVKSLMGYPSDVINFCSAPFSLVPLDTTLDREALSAFCNLPPHTLLVDWLKDVIQKEKEYRSLFSEQERESLYSKDYVNYFTPSILFREGTLTTLRLQFACLQQAVSSCLAKGKLSSAGDLLKELFSLREGAIGSKIYEAYNNPMPSPVSRLNVAIPRKQEKSLTPKDYYQASLGKLPSFKEIEEDGLYSPQKALEELYAASPKGDFKFNLDFASFKHNKEMQKFMFEATVRWFKTQREKPSFLIFSNHNALTIELLAPLWNNGIKNLEFHNCEMIDSKVFEQIRTQNPILESLTFVKCPKLEKFEMSPPIMFLTLKHCRFIECDSLNTLILRVPALVSFDYEGNPLLKTIEISSRQNVLINGKPKGNDSMVKCVLFK